MDNDSSDGESALARAWSYYQHADNLLAGRTNFFLVAESMLVAAFTALSASDVFLRVLISFLALFYTGSWYYVNERLSRRMVFLTKEYLKESDSIY